MTEATEGARSRQEAPTLAEVAGVFLKIGLIGFGGPAAHVALMRREVVERRHWLDTARFLRMFAACSLIPGPSSTELAIYLGYDQAGLAGLAVAGVLFILPAMLIMLGIAWLYAGFGTTPLALHLLYGIRPVVVAIVAWALLDVGRKALADRMLIPVAALVFGLMVLGLNPILLLAVGGVLVVLLRQAPLPLGTAIVLPLGVAGFPPAAGGARLLTIFLTFLKIGAVAYGSGYVLLAFLHADFVAGSHLLNEKQLADAIAIGQATPGPVFTTATFLGYLFGGVPGALLATLGIFLPGFVLVPLLDRVVRFVETHAAARAMLDGVNAATIGLIAAVNLQLAVSALTDVLTVAIAVASLLVLLRRPLLSPALIAAGALIGAIVR